MRRTINTRFLLVVLVLVVVLGTAGYGLHRFQTYRNAGIFLTKAETAEKEEEWGDAVKYLQWYVELKPGDIDAKAKLGSILIKLDAKRAAYGVLEDVLRRDPSRNESRRELVDVLLNMGRFRDALVHLERHLLQQSPDDPELVYRVGRCQAGLGQYSQAVASFQKTIELDAGYCDAYLAAATVLRRFLEKPSEADQYISRLLAANPDDLEAHHLAATYYYQHDQYSLAQQEAAAALAIDAEHIPSLLLAADVAIQLEAFAAANDYSRRILELEPATPQAYMLLARTAASQDDPTEAIDWLKQGLDACGPAPELLWSLAGTQIDSEQLDEADATLNRLAETDYPQQRVDFLRARLLCAREQWYEAARALQRVRPMLLTEPDMVKQVDFWLGMCYGELGNSDQQMAAFQRAVDTDPLWPAARAGRARALLGMGRISEALEEYRTLASLGQANAPILLQMARLMVLRNLTLPESERNWVQVQNLLDRLGESIPDEPAIPILRAEMLVSQDRGEEATELLREAEETFPGSEEVPLALAALAQRGGDLPEAEAILDRLEAEQGDSVGLRLARLRLLQQQGDEDALHEALPQFAEDAGQFNEEDRTRLLSGLAGYAMQLGAFELAQQWSEQLAQADPNNLRLRLLLFDLAVRSGDASSLGPILDDIARIEGRGPLWHYGSALQLFLTAEKGDQEKLQQAREHLTAVERDRPNWYRVPWLRAQIADASGQQQEATAYYVRAIELGDRNPSTVQRAVQLLYSQQRFVEADQMIRRMQAQETPFSSELGRLAADISLRLEEYDRAVDMARRAAKDSNDYRDHLWYGTVLSVAGLRARASGQNDQAQQYLDEAESELLHATEMAPEETGSWVALIQFYGRTGQREKAAEVIGRAQEAVSTGVAPLALAQCYEAMGDLEEAETQYQEALAASPDNPTVVRQVAEFYLRTGRSESAETQLQRIISGDVDAPSADVVWGRRAMALLMAARGGYENLTQGLALIEENLSHEDAAIQDRRAQAILLASHPKYQMRMRAREILENVVANSSDSSPQDRFILAQLYMASGDVVNASRHMRALLVSAGDQPGYVRAYAQFLLNQGEVAEASVWTSRLERMAPDQFSTVNLRANILVREKRYDEAIALLKGYLNRPIAEEEAAPTTEFESPTDAAEAAAGEAGEAEAAAAQQRQSVMQLRGAQVGGAFEQLGQFLVSRQQPEAAERFFAEAETQYRQFIEERPEARLLLAAFLARRGKLEQAVDAFEEAWSDSEPSLVQAAAGVLAGRVVDTEHYDRVRSILEQAVEKFDRPTSLLLILADMYGFRRDLPAALAVYEEILQRDPRNVVAMNNLAVMLAYSRSRLDVAQQLIDEAIELSGPNANLLDSRAIVSLARGNPREALRDLREAINDRPSATLYFHQAQALFAMQEQQAAARALQQGLEMGLSADALHPLERDAFADLMQSLQSRLAARG